MKPSGNAITRAPLLPASRMSRQAFSVEPSRSRNTEAACTAATFTVHTHHPCRTSLPAPMSSCVGACPFRKTGIHFSGTRANPLSYRRSIAGEARRGTTSAWQGRTDGVARRPRLQQFRRPHRRAKPRARSSTGRSISASPSSTPRTAMARAAARKSASAASWARGARTSCSATKFGLPFDGSPTLQGASRRYIKTAVEASLKRLKTDWIDLYQLHRPDPQTPIAETLQALNDLIKQGKVRYIGCSNLSECAGRRGAAGRAATGPRRLRRLPGRIQPAGAQGRARVDTRRCSDTASASCRSFRSPAAC